MLVDRVYEKNDLFNVIKKLEIRNMMRNTFDDDLFMIFFEKITDSGDILIFHKKDNIDPDYGDHFGSLITFLFKKCSLINNFHFENTYLIVELKLKPNIYECPSLLSICTSWLAMRLIPCKQTSDGLIPNSSVDQNSLKLTDEYQFDPMSCLSGKNIVEDLVDKLVNKFISHRTFVDEIIGAVYDCDGILFGDTVQKIINMMLPEKINVFFEFKKGEQNYFYNNTPITQFFNKLGEQGLRIRIISVKQYSSLLSELSIMCNDLGYAKIEIYDEENSTVMNLLTGSKERWEEKYCCFDIDNIVSSRHGIHLFDYASRLILLADYYQTLIENIKNHRFTILEHGPDRCLPSHGERAKLMIKNGWHKLGTNEDCPCNSQNDFVRYMVAKYERLLDP